jgi:transposase
VTEAGCLAHARRKFHELWVNHKSSIGEQALAMFGRLYEIEREVAGLDAARRRTIRQEKARPVADALRTWLTAQRQKVPPGSPTAKAIDYTLGRWAALTRYIEDGDLPARTTTGSRTRSARCDRPLQLAVRRQPRRKAPR